MEIVNINFRTYCHATEDPGKVKSALGFLIGEKNLDEPPDKKSYKFTTSKTKGYFGNPIITYEIDIRRSKEIKQFWTRLNELNPKLVAKFRDEISEMIDDNCSFHLRFDKQSAFQERYELTVHGDCVVFKAKIRAYPAKKEIALKNIVQFLDKL
ncbi:MAG: hypothetical protein KAJ51_17380 [Thermoplasmata archaeon]|nr:hypothetical protein [Thermoplasmata archaeon]